MEVQQAAAAQQQAAASSSADEPSSSSRGPPAYSSLVPQPRALIPTELGGLEVGGSSIGQSFVLAMDVIVPYLKLRSWRSCMRGEGNAWAWVWWLVHIPGAYGVELSF